MAADGAGHPGLMGRLSWPTARVAWTGRCAQRAGSRPWVRTGAFWLLPCVPPCPVFFTAARRRGRRGAARACFCAGGGRQGRLGRGDGGEARQLRAFVGNTQSSLALPSRPTSPPSSPPISQPSTGRRRTLDQPRHAGSPPPQPRYTHRPPEPHLLCELRPVPPMHTPSSFRKAGRFAGSSVEGGEGEVGGQDGVQDTDRPGQLQATRRRMLPETVRLSSPSAAHIQCHSKHPLGFKRELTRGWCRETPRKARRRRPVAAKPLGQIFVSK